ncbi:NTP transferase domain-containing protein [Dietzia aerolata]|uniref:NTP transferase domain-containing protein n=1 Tax=Dietzia aerolata TaxID=595984 RepID=UPI003635B85E
MSRAAGSPGAADVGATGTTGAGASNGTVGAIVLTGGRASRLGGVDKARLAVGGRPMVETVLRAARAVATAVVTVGPGGDTREEPPHSGPVAGIAAGLAALPQGWGR